RQSESEEQNAGATGGRAKYWMPTPSVEFCGSEKKPERAVVTAFHFVPPACTMSSIEPDWSSMMKRSSWTSCACCDSVAHAHAPAPWMHCEPMQSIAQAPQCAAFVFRFVSQPFAALPSQLPVPGAQSSVHAPATQVAGTLGPGGHTLPHMPQFCASFCVSDSH